MKPQIMLLLFFLALIFRRILPFVDLFYVFLIARLLLEPNRRQTVISLAITSAFVISFLADSPIGLFPLVLSTMYLIFSGIANYTSAKGTTLQALWIGFAAFAILLEEVLRLALTTSGVFITPDALRVTLGTVVAILLLTFAYSFKRKI